MQHLRRMEDRVVLLTGGGGGIARGVARAFADEGASMILTDIFPGGMEKTKAELEKDFGTDVVICVADGSNEDQVKAAIEKGVEHFGKLNVLINSAQTSASGLTLVEHTQADFDKAIYSGLYATFFYMKHAFPISFCASPYLPRGISSRFFLNISGFSCPHWASLSVMTKGRTTFTLISYGPHSLAATRDRPRIPSFAAA